MNIKDKVSSDDIERAKLGREDIFNTEKKDDLEIDMFSDLDDAFNSSDFGQGFGEFQQSPQQTSNEEKIFDATVMFLKGLFGFLKEFVTSFSNFNTTSRLETGRTIVIISIIVCIVGVIAIMFGKTKGINLIISSFLSSSIGIPLFYSAYIDLKVNNNDEGTNNDLDEESFQSEDFLDEDEEFIEEELTEDEYYDYFQDDFFEDETTIDNEVENNRELVVDNINTGFNGMFTRSYLYENISNCLTSINPSFNKVKTFNEEDINFQAWDAIIQNSAQILGGKNKDVEPMYLISLQEKLFYIYLSVKRPNWLKNVDSLVKEIINIYAFNRETGILNENIYGDGVSVGDTINIKIMKDVSTMISLRDTYTLVEKEILNTGNYIPVVLGIDTEGCVVFKDLKNVESLLIAGPPRSGKTWVALSIICQISAYLSPSEAQFYIFDPKGKLSDYKALEIPHVKKFITKTEDMLGILRDVVNVEGAYRQDLIGDAGEVNIWDYKKKNPSVKLPLLYIVIDEVITVAESMPKEVKAEFQSLLIKLVTRLPAAGIRIIMLPHVIKHEILSKTLTDNIPCRISVMGNAEHIEKSTGDKKFNHKLKNKGDLAVKFFNDNAQFVHASVLTKSNNDNAKFFDFLSKFWLKLEPDSYEDSVKKANEEIYTKKDSLNQEFDEKEFDIW
ncbi:FtsK/SpoIIIE domain-containing protein [Clostridioides sp. ZZV15-6597]|uniref:FtsK/SpoIIIE domain-containing protein n=1 Tax=Clostridioides sp. ZZV15-6597 TaxID=2811500 RepID=UPI001D0FF27C|nr:hypothetical protein [Clostridioides sp. ZZV15-6597]